MNESPPPPPDDAPPPPDALARIALEMTSVLDLGALLGTITDGLVAEFDAALARIWLLESPGDTRLRLRASSGLSRRLDGAHAEVAVGALKIGAVAAARAPTCLNGLADDPRVTDPAWVRAHGLRAFAAYPLLFRTELLGVLALFTRRPIAAAEFARIGTFAHQAAVAIQNARLFTALDAMAARLRDENLYLREEVRGAGAPAVGESPAWRAALDAARRVAPTDATALVTGETGTGKELLARAIHEWSPRRGRALVRVNCAAIAPALFESELFGHEKGAFTGAAARRAGRFELADGGTLFLDEVGELAPDAQAALLRAIQEREFERVGGSELVRVDVRVVAATNRDLAAEVAAGRFRADLYYRLNVFPIEAPPLRARPGDVPRLVAAFVEAAGRRLHKPLRGTSPEALAALDAYDWPGNVRELQNVIERAAILSAGARIELADLPPLRRPREPAREQRPADAGDAASLREVERRHIERVLAESDWTVEGAAGAAARLGLRPSTLRSRMAKLGVRRPR
jgi:transcriptional regulator with GAF, ATPase, and Fis domain